MHEKSDDGDLGCLILRNFREFFVVLLLLHLLVTILLQLIARDDHNPSQSTPFWFSIQYHADYVRNELPITHLPMR